MPLSLKKYFSFKRNNRGPGCSLIEKITTFARSSDDLGTAMRCAADEIGKMLELERVAILLPDKTGMRRSGEYSAEGVGQVEREKLRQLDLDLTQDLSSQGCLTEIADTKTDSRVSRRLAPAVRQTNPPSIRSILIVPLIIDTEAAGAIVLYRQDKRRWSTQ